MLHHQKSTHPGLRPPPAWLGGARDKHIGWRAHRLGGDPYFTLTAAPGTPLASRRAPQLRDEDRRPLQTVPTGV